MKTKTWNRIKESMSKMKTETLLMEGIIFFTVLTITLPANGQFKQGIQIRSGLATQSELFNICQNSDLMFTYGIGWLGEYQFNNELGLQTGLEYIQKGKSEKINEIRNTQRFHYLQVPVQAKFIAGEKAGLPEGRQFYVAAGPYISYLLSAQNHEL